MRNYPALFLDRDGVINIDKNYVHQQKDCIFIDGIFDLVRNANLLGYKVLVITNQAGIARGYYTEQQFLDFSIWMKSEFVKHDSKIDEVYFCPHHPQFGEGQYKLFCNCRKPQPGMLLRAKADFNIDMSKSILIGDNLSDMGAANNASVNQKYLFRPNKTNFSVISRNTDSKDLIDYITINSLSQVML